MTKRVFADTNVFVYAFSSDEPSKRKKARELLKKHVVFSTQVANELIWVLHRKFKVETGKISSILNYLNRRFEMLQISFKTIRKALQITSKYRFSYWDSLMLASALEGNCEGFLSEDLRNGQMIEHKLEIANPFCKLPPAKEQAK